MQTRAMRAIKSKNAGTSQGLPPAAATSAVAMVGVNPPRWPPAERRERPHCSARAAMSKVSEFDKLNAQHAEIDENLKRKQLTTWEVSQ